MNKQEFGNRTIHCGLIVWFQKISIPPPQRVMGKSEGEGGGSQRPKFLKESISLNWNIQGAGAFKPKKPSMGGVWIFSGTTH